MYVKKYNAERSGSWVCRSQDYGSKGRSPESLSCVLEQDNVSLLSTDFKPGRQKCPMTEKLFTMT